MPSECLAIIESKSKVRYSRNKPVVAKVSTNTSTFGISPDLVELKDRVKALLLDKKNQNQAPATVKEVEESYTPPPSFLPKVVENEPEATKDTVTPPNNRKTEEVQPLVVQTKFPILTSKPVNYLIIEHVASPASAPRPNQRTSIPYPSRMNDQKLRDKANDQREKFFQIFKDLNFNISFADSLILMPKFGPSIKSLLTNKDKLCELARTPLNEHCSTVLLKKLPEKLGDPRSFLKTERALIDVFEGELTLRVGKEAITFNLDQTSRYSANYNDMTTKRINFIDMACEEYSQKVLGFSDVIASGNPTPYYDLIFFTTSSTLTPFGNSDFLLEEVDAFLVLEDDPTSPKVDQSYLNSKGDILLLGAFLNDDPSLPPPNQGNYLPEVRKELKICETKSNKSSIDEPQEVELKDLPPHLKYAFLEGDDKFPVIIAKDLSVEEKTALITLLKSHKRAIAWKLSDIKGINPEFCTHKILIEDDFEPAIQHQRRANAKIHDVIKQEVLKFLDAGLIYPISGSPWVSLVHCVPIKGGFTVVENEENELILTRLVTSWRVCIDYRKLNEATRKDRFPLPFIDQMLERLAGNQYYFFLDGFSGYFQILIDPKDQEKTTFTAHTKRLLTAACLLGYAMHQAHFRAFLNNDPSLPSPNQGNYLPQVRKELKICEAKTNKSSIDEPLEVELKDLPPHLEYAFLEALLVANGSTQLSGVDVDENFSPVFKPDTICAVLSLAISPHWHVHHLSQFMVLSRLLMISFSALPLILLVLGLLIVVVTHCSFTALLVANGSTQLSGVDVDENFSPVFKPDTICAVLSLAISPHWPVHHLYVNNGFLHVDLTETVYMHQPPRFQDSAHPDYVCLLQQSVYGLK
nr:reverse transcriptase domain-containing protein [Tanacetum cinerariifolium]